MNSFHEHKTKKKVIFGLCLLIIVLPAPFKLFRTLEPAPKFIYDKNSQFGFERSVIIYRDEKVIAAASFIASATNGNLIADFYTSRGLFSSYDIFKVYPLETIGEHSMYALRRFLDTIVINEQYYNSCQIMLLQERNFTEAVERLNSLPKGTNCIYNNGEVVTWNIP